MTFVTLTEFGKDSFSKNISGKKMKGRVAAKLCLSNLEKQNGFKICFSMR
jgi:hypothetical protein